MPSLGECLPGAGLASYFFFSPGIAIVAPALPYPRESPMAVAWYSVGLGILAQTCPVRARRTNIPHITCIKITLSKKLLFGGHHNVHMLGTPSVEGTQVQHW